MPGSLGGNPFSYIQSGEAPVQAQGGDKSASTLAAEARARLADIIGSPETEKAVEKAGEIQSPANDYSKFQQPGKAPLSDLSNLPPEFPDYTKLYPEYRGGAPASAEPATDRLGRPLIPEENVPRPPADVFPAARLAPNGKEPELFVVHHTGPSGGTPESIVEGWRSDPSPSRRNVVGSQYIMDRNGVIHDTANEYGYTAINHAKDFNIPGTGISKDQGTSNRSIVGMEIIAKDEKDVTPAQQAALVRFANERYPDTPFYGHGEISGNRMNDEGIPGAQAVLASRPAPFNFDWSNAPIPGPANGPPTQPLPEGASRPPGDIGTPFVNDGTPFGPPAPPGYTGKPAGPSGVEKAQTFLNTSVDKLLQQFAPDKAGPASMFIDTKQPLREALKGPYGDRILTEIQPRIGEAGLKRDDLAKAIANPAARFFGSDEEIANRQLAPGEITANWNKNIYEGQNVSAMPRDESLGADPNPFTVSAPAQNIEDRRFDPELTLRADRCL